MWGVLREIPSGETRSYSEIARQIGRPTAICAVARDNGANLIALMIAVTGSPEQTDLRRDMAEASGASSG